ncbi:MAG TPA: adenylate kinase [Vicinamibacteria bacterium]
MLRLILLGPPGAGKGTQAEKLAEELEVPHISTGDILRQAVAEGTELGLEAKKVMEAGELVSDEIMLGIIRERLARDDARRGYILDGYPRTLPQARSLQSLMDERSEPPVVIANIDVDREELVRRISGRRSCPNCKAVFNVHAQPPKKSDVCDACGQKLTQRADDEEATVRQRLAVYDRQTRPLLDYYGDRVTPIDGQGTPQEVFDRLSSLVGQKAERGGRS